MSKILVAYFSATGTTKRVAERLARVAQADLFEIRPAVPYSSADLDWTNKASRTSKERADESIRPALAVKLADVSAYATVYIGFPIWWYVAPRIIATFLESCDFSGKTIVPFATSGGSGMGRTVEELKRICPAARFLSGQVLNGISDKGLADWVAFMN
ncbi:flavodoxin [Mitsuokella multacida]|uniref:Flavodoxin n=1 Tax=Mitsuokella multacida TaxID=52226 RepID=A0A414NZ56_9FIRM|nr:flavodoxin [Mitsuokella multacida]MDO5583337.1 flavodoxin [Mitsuokella multacida]RHF52957.1 flavodoxin [Mitsuokella multacida]